MMKLIPLSLVVAVILSGCAIVKTYDGQGNLLGECDAYGFGFIGSRFCSGSASPYEQRGPHYVEKIQNIDRVDALYQALYGMYSESPKIASDYLKMKVDEVWKNKLSEYVRRYKSPRDMSSNDEIKFCQWLAALLPSPAQ